jgi:putative ABC transport system permease protein
MQFALILNMALTSLKANKVRSFLTMLGVIIGVASVILLISVGSGLQSYITKELEGIGSNLIIAMPGKIDFSKMGSGGGAAMTTQKFTLKDARDIKANSVFVEEAIPTTATQGIFKYEEKKVATELVGITYNFVTVLNSPLSEGESFTEGDDRAGRKVVVLGSGAAKDLFGDKNPIGEKVSVGTQRFTVIGILKSRGLGGSETADQAAIPINTAMRIYNQNKVFSIYIKAISPDKVNDAMIDIKATLLNRLTEDDFTLMTQKDLLSTISSILSTLTLALGGIAAISLVVGGIGIMNIMLVSVTERTREIGLRKALGATPNIILTQFLIEAVVLSVGGGLIGITIGAGGAIALSKFLPAQVTLWAVLLAFGVSALIGVIFGVMPARRAAQMNPIEALRYE